MWVFTNQGFISIVRNRDKGYQDTFLVRARRRKDLHAFFGGTNIDEFITHNPQADYHYRVLVDADTLKSAMAYQVDKINYGNFKNSIPETDHDLRHFAGETWLAGFRNIGEHVPEVPVLTSVNTQKKDTRHRS
jgi:hypothetical protein